MWQMAGENGAVGQGDRVMRELGPVFKGLDDHESQRAKHGDDHVESELGDFAQLQTGPGEQNGHG